MLFNSRSLLPSLACVLAAGQLVTSAPYGDEGTLGQSASKNDLLTERAPAPFTMDLWAGSINNGIAAWKKLSRSLFASADTAKKDAKKGYEYVMSQTDKSHRDDVQLVAGLHIGPGTGQGVYLSSIPKAAQSLMTKEAAPAWYHQVRDLKRDYHAEDGSMWQFENALTTKLSATAQYPRGSTIFVYGHFKKDGKAQDPSYHHPCSIGAIDKSCICYNM